MKNCVYYAHSVSLYNTEQEKRDILLLKELGFIVINPNSPSHARGYERLKAQTGDGMPYFDRIISDCQGLAFRAHPDGSIPAGVAKEIRTARKESLWVIELPSGIERRAMTVEETREYLVELGVR